MIRHGHSRRGRWTPEYISWVTMVKRCTNHKDKNWPSYGGRGITVCDRWRESFEAFYADMGPRPPGMSIDRTNNNGNYEPSNCRWITHREQMLNMRNNTILTAGGCYATVAEWAEVLGWPYSTLIKRVRRGWSHERALMTPRQRRADHGTGR